MRSLVVRRRSYDAFSKSRPKKIVSSHAGKGNDSPSPDSRERSAARERACFAARRANGATKIDVYNVHASAFREPTVLGNILREFQRAIIRRGRRRRDIIHHTWGNIRWGTTRRYQSVSYAPHSSASEAVSMRAVNTRSLALDKPSSRTARCVPPAPGMIPRRTSGRPILVTSWATTREHRASGKEDAYQPRASRKQNRAQGHHRVRGRLWRRWSAWAGSRAPTARNGDRRGTC